MFSKDFVITCEVLIVIMASFFRGTGMSPPILNNADNNHVKVFFFFRTFRVPLIFSIASKAKSFTSPIAPSSRPLALLFCWLAICKCWLTQPQHRNKHQKEPVLDNGWQVAETTLKLVPKRSKLQFEVLTSSLKMPWLQFAVWTSFKLLGVTSH